MDIFELSKLIGQEDNNNEAVVKYLQDHGLLRSNVSCVPCGRPYSQVKKKGSVTGYVFRCPSCHRKQQLATGTFMEGAHLAVKKLMALMYFWAYEEPVSKETAHTHVSSKTVVQWYQYFRDICSWKMLATVISLGDPGLIVQINEAKYHRGHQLGEPQRWVFGIYDPVKKEGYMQLVQHRDANTLLPIIRQYVPVGTEIWLDEWPAYHGLSAMGYTHRTVNHSRKFKDPVTGVCTNHVEVYWMPSRGVSSTCAVCRRR